MTEQDRYRERICHIMAFNEALFGQSRVRLDGLLEQTGVTLGVDFNRPFSLCLTGVEKRFYARRLGLDRAEFVRRSWALIRQGMALLDELGGSWDVDIVQYDQSKQLCFLFALPDGAPQSPLDVALALHTLAEEMFGGAELLARHGLSAVTALVEHVEGYETLSNAFREAKRLNRCGFFLTGPGVMTARRLEALVRPCPMAEVRELVDTVERAVAGSDGPTLEEALRALFLDLLGGSFDLALVRDVLAELRKKLLRFDTAFRLDLAEQIERLQLPEYASIRELREGVLDAARLCADAVGSSGRRPGRLTLKALCFLRENYSRSIGLQEAADVTGVTPAYLSRVFQREMGESLTAHLAHIRMDHAAALLDHSGKTVAEIGREVGIPNPQYFGALFKRCHGVPPQKYRQRQGAAEE